MYVCLCGLYSHEIVHIHIHIHIHVNSVFICVCKGSRATEVNYEVKGELRRLRPAGAAGGLESTRGGPEHGARAQREREHLPVERRVGVHVLLELTPLVRRLRREGTVVRHVEEPELRRLRAQNDAPSCVGAHA